MAALPLPKEQNPLFLLQNGTHSHGGLS